MRYTLRALGLGLILLGLAAAPAFAEKLVVSAAASLTNAFTEACRVFAEKNPGLDVSTNFAASNPLLRQMAEGAPVDVAAFADQATMDAAAQKKLIDESTRVNFALNSVVLIVPAQGGPALSALNDLKGGGVKRLAIGNPESVPAGRYAKAALTAAGLWDALGEKFIMGESVRQTLDYVARGEVDAGIVYATDAKQAGDKVKVVLTLSGHEPVLYPAAVTKNSQAPGKAKAFVDFLRSPEGATILGKYGFSKP
ncbi:MAG: molybdate ABC transporter substrate-binding protein [Desulfovibrio sp.]|jgi:molybdate transport system substrate-binding protein|nr:molybdate ABC transporter substrate-binding protein [Desulfovibrio sp.]